jgi:hypothetical protein
VQKPLLIKSGAQPESPPLASSGLPEPPRLGYTDGNTLARCRHRHRAHRRETEFGFGAGVILVPATGFEPATIGLKARPELRNDASSELLLNSVLRISPPHGTTRSARVEHPDWHS